MRRPELGRWVILLVAGAAVSALAAQPAPSWASGDGAVTISPERAAALAVNTLEAVDGGFRLHNPRHRASFTADGVTVSPRGGGPSWSWRLARVGPAESNVSLIGGAPVQPAKPEAGVVRYARGMLDEEYALEAGDIEQRFVLRAPLPLDGASLVLEGVVGCDGAFSAARGGWEWRGGRGAVWLGPATVIDAKGAIVPSSFEVSAVTTRLIVEGNVLASATYPVTIDPEIRGYELRISDMGGTGDPVYGARVPAVAYNSVDNQYLVVWNGDETGSGFADDEFEIFGQRIDAATGAELGANDFRISDMGGTGDPAYDAHFPAVAYNAMDNEYLVVWEGDDDVGGLVNMEFEIFGQRIDAATGAAVGANDFRISDMGDTGDPDYDAGDSTVVYNGTLNEYLVVWWGDDNVGYLVDDEFEIFVQCLDAATGSQIGNDLRISGMGGSGDPDYDASFPAVAYNSTNNEYLVVWAGDDNVGGLVDGESEVFGQRLDALSLIAVGVNDFRISDMGGTGDPDYDASFPAVAYNSTNNEYLVVWHGYDDVGGLVLEEFEIFGQRLDAEAGAALGSNDFRISDMGGTGDPAYAAWHATVAYDSTNNEYLVVWMGDDDVGGLVDEEYETFGQRLDAATGSAFGANDFRISEMGGTGSLYYDAGFRPAVASGGGAGQYLVVWYGDDNTGGLVDNEFEIFGKMLGILPFSDGFESGDSSAWSTTVP